MMGVPLYETLPNVLDNLEVVWNPKKLEIMGGALVNWGIKERWASNGGRCPGIYVQNSNVPSKKRCIQCHSSHSI